MSGDITAAIYPSWIKSAISQTQQGGSVYFIRSSSSMLTNKFQDGLMPIGKIERSSDRIVQKIALKEPLQRNISKRSKLLSQSRAQLNLQPIAKGGRRYH
jgi:hypothetical protein